MKTISLTESAYHRLASWKDGRTFSEVIERMIPPKGTIEAAFEAATRSEQLNMAQEELWRARRQFASEVRKLRLGLKLMLTLGLAIKDARAASG